MSDVPCPERQQLVDMVNSETGQTMLKRWMPMEHDWRLYERVVADPTAKVYRWNETWYCVRCRHIETRSR